MQSLSPVYIYIFLDVKSKRIGNYTLSNLQWMPVTVPVTMRNVQLFRNFELHLKLPPHIQIFLWIVFEFKRYNKQLNRLSSCFTLSTLCFSGYNTLPFLNMETNPLSAKTTHTGMEWMEKSYVLETSVGDRCIVSLSTSNRYDSAQ